MEEEIDSGVCNGCLRVTQGFCNGVAWLLKKPQSLNADNDDMKNNK